LKFNEQLNIHQNGKFCESFSIDDPQYCEKIF
jgi:hypothetical protein